MLTTCSCKASCGMQVILCKMTVILMLIQIPNGSLPQSCLALALFVISDPPINDGFVQPAMCAAFGPGMGHLHTTLVFKAANLLQMAWKPFLSHPLTLVGLCMYSSCCSSFKADRVTGSSRLTLSSFGALLSLYCSQDPAPTGIGRPIKALPL